MREIRYANGRGPGCPNDGRVKYVLQGNHCIFSGLTREFMSTINAAEFIIEAIAEAERIDPRTMTFSDLRTSRGYGDLKEGQHQLLKLTVKYRGPQIDHVDGWEPIQCPPEILHLFTIPFTN